MKNLWKDLDNLKSDVMNPIDFIKVQSDYLQDGTDNMFYIRNRFMDTVNSTSKNILKSKKIVGTFKYSVEICSEFLPDYSYPVMGMYYDLTFYPLIINVSYEVGKEIENDQKFFVTFGGDSLLFDNGERLYYVVESQEEFECALAAIFNCPTVKTVMKNMKTIIDEICDEESFM